MKHRFLNLLFFLIIGTVTGQESLEKLLNQYNSHSIPYISVENLRMNSVKGKGIILDAREKAEFNISHIPSARYVGYNSFSLDAALTEIPEKDSPIIVYCSIGIRSEKIAEKLKKAGFIHVKNLYGGIFEWKNKGFPTVDSTGAETENIHAYSKEWGKWLHAGDPVY